MNTNKRQYDLICSLGGNCAAAFQMKYRDMRQFSLPFDWVYIENEKPIEYLCEGFKNNFQNLALKENLRRIEGTKEHPVIYQDIYSGYFFPNHFVSDFEKEYSFFYETLRRRIARLLDKIASARNVLFGLSTSFPLDIVCLEKLNDVLSSTYPNVHFELKNLSFACPEEKETVLGNVSQACHVRQLNVYDFYKTNFEWAFLDGIEISGKQKDAISLVSFKCFGRRYKLKLHIGRKKND